MSRLFLRDQRGNIAALFGLAAVPLAIAAGAAVDYSRLAARRTDLQRIADGAALNAAKVLSTNYGQSDTQRQSAAAQAANANAGALAPTAQTATTVSLATASATVRMSETLNLAFGGLLGQNTSAVSAQATAKYRVPVGCILALNKTALPGIDVEGSASIQAPSCSVWSNATNGASSITLNSAASITAGKVCAVGGGSGGSVNPKLETHCEPASDPFAGRTLSASSGCTYTNTVIKSDTTLYPGVYCGGLSIQSASVTLSPGLYQVRTGAFSVQGHATILNGNGVSFLLGSGGYLDFQGSPTLNLSAMTTGPLSGLVFASDPSTPAQISTLKGNVSVVLNAKLAGSIYLPKHTLNVGGSTDLTLSGAQDALVVSSLVVAGSSNVTTAASLSTSSSITLTQ